MGFLYKADLYNQQVFYSELKVYQHKQILKCFIGDKIDPAILIQNLNDIILSNTKLKQTDINNLNYIDYFLLVLYIRYTSIGDLIFAEINTDKKTKLQISISKIIDEFKEFERAQFLHPTIIKNIEIRYTIPNINSVIELQNKEAQNNFYLYFTDSISVDGKVLNFKELTPKEIETIFNNLPVKITSQIIKQVTNIVTKLNSFCILKFLPDLEQKIYFNLNIDSFCNLLRLIFGGDLLSVYENIFALSKYGNLPPNYIEQCTPGEYLFFVKKLEELAKKQTADKTSQSSLIESPFEDGLS